MPNSHGATIPLQPMPALAIVRCLDDYSAVTRTWTNDDHQHCRRCVECDAVPAGNGMAICTVIVDQPVAVAEAQLFSCYGFDLADDEPGSRPRLGLALGLGPG